MPAGQKQGFTPAEHNFVIKCVNEGLSAQYCAAKLGRSESGVLAHAIRAGLHFPNRKVSRKQWPRRYG